MRTTRLVRLMTQRHARHADLHAIAFILTEMQFRDWFFRFAELCSAAFSVFVLRLEPTLTIGIAQVSFSYWRRRYGSNNVALFSAAFDDVANYQICCDYLEANQHTNPQDMIAGYNGRPSALYVRLFYKNLSLVESLADRLRSVKMVQGQQA